MGFLSTLGKIGGAVGGFVVGGPAGAVAGSRLGGRIGSGLEGNGSRIQRPFPTLQRTAIQQRTAPQIIQRRTSGPLIDIGPFEVGRRQEIETFQPGGVRFPTQQQRAQENGRMLACPAGFRPNKSDYFLKDGTFIEAGTRCVKIRRRNPLNPRAASRAVSRIQSAKRAVGLINRISIRKKC